MIIQRTEDPSWLSNSYLIVDRPGGSGAIVDTNAVMLPLLERLEREGTELACILLTHHHDDHVEGVSEIAERFDAPVLASEAAMRDLGSDVVDRALSDGERLEIGSVEVEAIATPGHMAGHLSFLFDGSDCLTGDTLFAGSVGGTRAPSATGFDDLHRSVMRRLMGLDHSVRVHPGHTIPTTIGREWATNAFIRAWRGVDRAAPRQCRVELDTGDEVATLLLRGPDYDGGTKAWVELANGTQEILPGSRVHSA